MPRHPGPVSLPTTRLLLLSGLAAFACGSPVETGRRIRLDDGVELAVTVRGRGDTVIVVGGTPGLPREVTVRAFRPLERAFTLVHYDARGRGASGGFVGPEVLQRDVRDLAVLRDRLGLARSAVIGVDYGAIVAAFSAVQEPERTERLALVGPMRLKMSNAYELSVLADIDREVLTRYLAATRAGRDTLDPDGFCREFWPRWLSPVWIRDDRVRAMHADDVCGQTPARLRSIEATRDTLLAALNGGGAWDFIDSVGAVRVPTLVVSGAGDEVREFLHAWWAHAVPGARLVRIADGEPSFPWVPNPAEVAAELRPFLRGAWPARARPVTEPPEAVGRQASAEAAQ